MRVSRTSSDKAWSIGGGKMTAEIALKKSLKKVPRADFNRATDTRNS